MGRLTYGGPSGTLSVIKEATGFETTLVYNTAGKLRTVTDGRGHVTQFGYDTSNKLTTLTAAVGTTVQAQWSAGYNATPCDAGLTCTTWTNPNNHAAKRFYSPANQVVKTTDPNANSMSST